MQSEGADAYATIAEWYDVEHDSLTLDAECYHELLSSAGRRVSHVLEIGSGTGRLLAALATAGYNVTGVEPSAPMRARGAKRMEMLPDRVARRIRVRDGTAESPGLAPAGRFDAAILGLNMLAHLVTLDARRQTARAISAHLHIGGLLIVDLDLAGPRRLAETMGQVWWQGTWPVPESDRMLTHTVVASAAEGPDVILLTHFYDVHAQGGAVERTVARMPLALLSVGEVRLLLEHAGFTITDVFGGYALDPYGEGAQRAIILAERAE